MENLHLICILFFLIATIYSSVGFGGGSSYLAILALSSLSIPEIRSIALLANISVVGINLIVFQRKFAIPWKRAIPLCSLSIPLAFIGGQIQLEDKMFFTILGAVLLLAGSILVTQNIGLLNKITIQKQNNYVISAIIGFISGLVSIGGGIFLAPYLYLSKWDRPKNIAATSSLFILVNSIAALISLWINNKPQWQSQDSFPLVFLLSSVVLGSILGKKITFAKSNPTYLKGITGALILLVAFKILLN